MIDIRPRLMVMNLSAAFVCFLRFGSLHCRPPNGLRSVANPLPNRSLLGPNFELASVPGAASVAAAVAAQCTRQIYIYLFIYIYQH